MCIRDSYHSSPFEIFPGLPGGIRPGRYGGRALQAQFKGEAAALVKFAFNVYPAPHHRGDPGCYRQPQPRAFYGAAVAPLLFELGKYRVDVFFFYTDAGILHGERDNGLSFGRAEQLGAKGHLSSGTVIFDGVRDKVYQQLLDAQLVREDVQASLKGRQSESQPLPRRRVGVYPVSYTHLPPVVKYKIMNYTKYAEKYWETLKVFDTEEKTRYPLRCSESVIAILTARPMDIIADVDKFKLYNKDIDIIFKPCTRERFLGINVWVNDIGNIKDIGMKLFEFNLAPGFSKAELKAIMPKGAKMYELSDLVGSDWQSNYPWLNSGNQNMNSALFSGASSNGDGNGSIYTKRGSGIMGLQHIPSDSCECPLCLRQAGKEY